MIVPGGEGNKTNHTKAGRFCHKKAISINMLSDMFIQTAKQLRTNAGPAAGFSLLNILFRLTFHNVNREAPLAGFFILSRHVFTCLAHCFDTIIQRYEMRSIPTQG